MAHTVLKMPWSFPSPLVSMFHSLIATISSHCSNEHVYAHPEQGSHGDSPPDTKFVLELKAAMTCYLDGSDQPADFLNRVRLRVSNNIYDSSITIQF